VTSTINIRFYTSFIGLICINMTFIILTCVSGWNREMNSEI